MAKNQVLEITKRTQEMVQAHMAKLAAVGQITGVEPSSMPGSENDGTVDAAAIAASAAVEVKDRITPEPDGVRKPGGEGDNSDLTRGQATDSTQTPPEKPEAEAMDQVDAFADRPSEKAAGLCNDILTSIRQYQKEAVAKGPGGHEADGTGPHGKGKGPGKGKADGSGLEAEETKKVNKTEEAKKAEPIDEFELNQEVLAKIASVLLSTKEGWDFAEAQLSKAAGANDAKEIMSHVAEEEDKAMSYYTGIADSINEVKFAKIAEAVKAGQLAPEDGEAMAAQEAVSPEDVAQADAEGGLEGSLEEEAGDMGEIDPREIVQVLVEAVESGEMQPEEAEQLATYIAEAAGGEAPTEEAAPAEVTPEEADSAEGVAPKEAEVKFVKDAVASIRYKKDLVDSYNKGIQDAKKTVKAAQEAEAAQAGQAIRNEMAGEGEINPEEVVQALIDAVESGEVSEDEAVQVIQELSGEGSEEEAAAPAGGEVDVPTGADEALTPEMAGDALGSMVDEGDLTPKQAAAIITKMYTK